MKVNDIAYLCGYFTATGKDVEGLLCGDPFWTMCRHTPEDLESERKYYFPEFLDLCLCEVKTYRHAYGQVISVPMRDGSVRQAMLTDINVYLYPFGIVMYSIGIRQEGVELPDALNVLLGLRMTLDASGVSDFEKFAVAPLATLAARSGADRLLESGNKYKIFHIAVSDSAPAAQDELYRLLFSAGTLAMYDEEDSMSFTKEYFDGIVSQGRVSVFRNWGALSLLDTFTIFAFSPKEFMLQVWAHDYFEKLYLYTLFRKFFLFRLNHSFRADKSRISRLKDDLEAFDRNYSFPVLSYNFLPEMIAGAMENGLDIADEKEKISVMVNQEKERREAETGDKMNLFLGVISALTLFSAIWDFSCLMDGLFVFGDSIGTVTGFRACTMLILGIICLVILLTRWFRK